MDNLPRIALIIPGGIGTGKDNIGVPVLERIVRLLSNDFSVTVFQLFPRNRNYSPVAFELVDIYSTLLPIRLIKFCIVFFRHNRKKRFTVVHGFWALPGGLLAVLMGKIFGIKSMVSILGGDTISLPEIDYGQLRSFFYRKIVFWTLREADEVIALTRYLEKNLEAFGFRKTNIHIVPWGIDNRLFSYIEKPLENKVRFLHVGNLHPVKDQRTLLKAFKIVSDQIDAKLTIIGEGILADEIESVVGDLALDDKVKFINQQPYETLPSYYHAADVLLHTSLSEGQCEVVTEAMSSGLLVCGTRVGLMYDLPDCCLAVDVGDYKGLAAAILAILRNPDEIKRIKNNARRWSADHPIEWTAGQLSAFYLR